MGIIILTVLAHSKLTKNMKYVRYTILLLHLKITVSLFNVTKVLKMDEKEYMSLNTVMNLLVFMANFIVMTIYFKKYRVASLIINNNILFAAGIYRFYGFDNVLDP